MTDYAEEQSMEVEALEAIYGEDFVSEGEGRGRVELVPIPGEGEDVNHVSLTLRFTFPETYPDVAPALDLSSAKGLKEDALASLRGKLLEETEESLGMPMIFGRVCPSGCLKTTSRAKTRCRCTSRWWSASVGKRKLRRRRSGKRRKRQNERRRQREKLLVFQRARRGGRSPERL